MTQAASLRLRLTAIILAPLMTFSVIAGLWQLANARNTAADVFDRSLLSAALAVANDVTISGGDALSARTRDILSSTSGGRVFYHVYAPDGVIVAGYATPPVGIARPEAENAAPTYFNAIYLGQPVSGVRLQNRAEIDGFAGIFTTTVWQDSAVRTSFVRDLVLRSFLTILGLILLLAVTVWFGVRVGLRPLTNLEQAIAQRSGSDLGPIRRAVPDEVSGIVQTLNRLFGQVSSAMTAQSEFIANAAHQLRNPIAGVLSLAEAVTTAPSEAETKRRAQDLLTAAKETADLSQKLLMLERAEKLAPDSAFVRFDLASNLRDWVGSIAAHVKAGVDIDLDLPATDLPVTGDPTMLREAVANLIDNAVRHGGPEMSRIKISAARTPDTITLCLADNGIGLAQGNVEKALERFTPIAESSASGLGLPIVQAIVKAHRGNLQIADAQQGLHVQITLPRL
jgi:two-component system sensor histidine kinase TctE